MYDSLLWIRKKDGENVYKEPYMKLNEIDQMDIFFWLDIQIYEAKKQDEEATSNYDKMGL
jgi:hypothetical protein